MSIGTLVAFLAYSQMYIWPVRQMGRVLTELGKQPVVVAWFPAAFTQGCTIECKSLAANGDKIRKYDVAYFMASALLVQVTTLLTMKPAMVLFDWAASSAVQRAVAGQPFVVQFAGILVLTDLAQYWVHRAYHEVPALWRLHGCGIQLVHCTGPQLSGFAAQRMAIPQCDVPSSLRTRSITSPIATSCPRNVPMMTTFVLSAGSRNTARIMLTPTSLP